MDTHPVGTGPYQVKDYVYNQYVRLIRNEEYWKKEAKIKNIIVDLSAERSGRLIKFFNNECQIASSPEISQLGLLSEKKCLLLFTINRRDEFSLFSFQFSKIVNAG